MGARQSESDEEALVAIATEQSPSVAAGEEDEPGTACSVAPEIQGCLDYNAGMTPKNYADKLRADELWSRATCKLIASSDRP